MKIPDMLKGCGRAVPALTHATPANILELSESVEIVDIGGGQPPIIDPNQRRGNPMPYGVVAPPNDATQEFKTVSNVNFFEGAPIATFPDITKKAFFRGFIC
jgi:hypothetical protein